MSRTEPIEEVDVDLSLLNGFRFSCRPGCGLCCYATPAASPAEQRGLLQLDPSVRFVGGSGGFRLVPARPEGGACRFLSHEQCTVHPARPFPCREYPLSVHRSVHWQATVVLACPGVTTLDLGQWRGSGAPTEAPIGLSAELATVRSELARAPGDLDGAARRWRRALRAEGISADDGSLGELRDEVRELGTRPTDDDLTDAHLPDPSEGIALLPLYFDRKFGRVALAAAGDGAELLQLRETGGVQESLARFAQPGRMPRLTAEAEVALDGYLSYVLRRDAFLGAVLEAAEEGPLAERLALELRSVGADVVARATWRAQLEGGEGGRLDAAQVWEGIRATDADLMDRPTVGGFL